MSVTIEELFGRKSMRAFTDKPIDPMVKGIILETATHAPTAGCQQLYTILDITNQELKNKLAKTCDNQPFIATAPMVLIFCADCKRWYDAYVEAGCQPRAPRSGDLFLAFCDALVAAQNAVVAAQAMKLGSCYIGDIIEWAEIHQDMLGLPKWVVPAAMLVFGHPTQAQLDHAKPKRINIDYIVQENTYTPWDGKALRTMFERRTEDVGYDTFMKEFCKRKYEASFSREMSRSLEMYLKDFRGE